MPVLLLLLAVVVLPTQAFLYNRYQSGKRFGYQHNYEFYNRSELPAALAAASIQQAIIDDMSRLRDTTSPSSLILYFEPSLVSLLADRRSLPLASYISQQQFDETRTPHPDYIYLSSLHPRNTGTYNGLELLAAFKAVATPLWMHRQPDSEEPLALLFAVPAPNPLP